MDLDEIRRAREARLGRIRRRRATLARINGEPFGHVDAAPIREHLHALNALGWSWSAIAAMHGDSTYAGIRLIATTETTQAHRRMDSLRRIPLSYRVPDGLPDAQEVPPHGAQRRVRALIALGWTHDHIRDHADGYTTHGVAHGRFDQITAGTWRRIDRAYRALSTTPGPRAQNRTVALRHGYAPPAAFDDIDDPFERPKGLARPA